MKQVYSNEVLSDLISKYSKEPLFIRAQDKDELILNVGALRCAIEDEFTARIKKGFNYSEEWIVTNRYSQQVRAARYLSIGMFVGFILSLYILRL